MGPYLQCLLTTVSTFCYLKKKKKNEEIKKMRKTRAYINISCKELVGMGKLLETS